MAPLRFATLLLLLVTAAAAQPPGVEIEKVVGPETPTGRYKHPAAITQLADGTLFLAYYGGDGEYAPGTAVYGMRRSSEGGPWSAPAVLATDPFYSVGNPVVWQAPDGVVWLWYVIRPGQTWSTSRIAAKVSRDGARTWSDSTVVTFDEGMMVRSKPLALPNGGVLLPVYHETGHDTEKVGADTTSLFLRFDPAKKIWAQSNRVTSRLGNLQPALARINETHLVAFCRRGGDYEPGDDGYVVRTESRDGGQTWSPGEETEFPNPNAAVELLGLASGSLLLVYNDSMTDRTPLAAALSTDGGETFPRRVTIAEGKNSYAYPYAIQTQDGLVRLLFTSDGRTTVNMATFAEETIR